MHLKPRQVVCIFPVTVYDAACHNLLLQCRGSQLVPICMECTSDSKMRVNNRQIVLKSSSRRLSRLGSIYSGLFFFFILHYNISTVKTYTRLPPGLKCTVQVCGLEIPNLQWISHIDDFQQLKIDLVQSTCNFCLFTESYNQP